MRLPTILTIFLLLVLGSLGAQNANGLLFTAPTEARDAIQLKWLTQEIATKEGFNLYRRSQGTTAWELVNASPLAIGQVPIPPQRLAADTSLQVAQQLALTQDLAKLPGMSRFNFVTFAVVDPDFARFLGIHYDDGAVLEGQTYEYEVRALRGGRERLIARSGPVSLGDPLDYPQAPTITGAYDPGDKQVDFNWSHDENLAFAYQLTRIDPVSGEIRQVNKRPILVLSNSPDQPEFRDPTPGNAQNYRYELSSIDYLGRVSPLTSSVEVELPDLLAPEPPTNPTSDNSVDGVITLGWTASSSTDTKNYRIYRSADADAPAVLVGETEEKALIFTDDKFPGYGYYYYEIRAVDEAGNESEMPLFHIANAKDLYPPSSPQNVRITATSGSINLDWTKNAEGDLAGYVIMRSVDVKGTNDWAALHVEPFPENRFADRLPPSRRNTMIYHVIAMDTSGNRSKPSAVVRIAMPDVVAPPVPFLHYVRTGGDTAYLAWEPVTEADMRGYQLERKTEGAFTVVARPDKGVNTYAEVGLTPGSRVEYRLSSVDTMGNVSAPSQTMGVTITRTTGDANPLSLEGKYRKRVEGVALKWTGQAGKSYVFRRKGNQGRFQPLNEIITSNQFIDKPSGKGTYDYFVKTYFPDGTKADSPVISITIK